MRAANEIKTERSRRLRKAATDAETALWYRLRSRRLNGYKFVRQEPIVLGNMAGVLETIATALAEAPPHPDR